MNELRFIIRQIIAETGDWYYTVPHANSSWVSELEVLAKYECIEATNPVDALEMLAWDRGWQGAELPEWAEPLGKQLGVDVISVYNSAKKAH